MPPSKHDPILIIGAGTFGLSLTLSLLRAGYTCITVLEKDAQIPSRFSAGHDLNKIIRAEYADPFYTDLSLVAIRRWQTDPLYAPHYRETGYLNVVSAAAAQATRDGLRKYLESIEGHEAFRGKVKRVKGGEEVKGLARQFEGRCGGWEGYFNEMAGYAHSRNAMGAVYGECVRFGDKVRFRVGPEGGDVERLLFDDDDDKVNKSSTSTNDQSQGRTRKCVGAITRDGLTHRASTTIITAGAGVVSLLPSLATPPPVLPSDADSQHNKDIYANKLGIAARCWGVVHIQLTPEEAAAMRGMPVTMVRDLAFFFEPDRETNKLKFCHMGGGYHHHHHGAHDASVTVAQNEGSTSSSSAGPPPRALADSQFVPEIDVQHIRRLLHEALPQLVDRPLIDAHLCWIADSSNSDFVIDFAPSRVAGGQSLAIATGDSGHGFKMLPIMGDLIREVLERGEQELDRWRWATHERIHSESVQRQVADGGGESGGLHGVRNWRNGAGKALSDLARAKL